MTEGKNYEDNNFLKFWNEYQFTQLPSKSLEFYFQNIFIRVSENVYIRVKGILLSSSCEVS